MSKSPLYSVSTKTDRSVQLSLKAEQARRALKGQTFKLSEIASEWLAEKAKEHPVG